MKKTNEFLKNNPIYFLIGLLLIIIINTCQSNRQMRAIQNINTAFPKKTIEKMLLEHQKDFLRYEDDIDNKQKSIEDVMSEIDQKIILLDEKH